MLVGDFRVTGAPTITQLGSESMPNPQNPESVRTSDVLVYEVLWVMVGPRDPKIAHQHPESSQKAIFII